MAEADYCGKEAKDMQDHWVKIGWQEIPVHVIDATDDAADCEKMEMAREWNGIKSCSQMQMRSSSCTQRSGD